MHWIDLVIFIFYMIFILGVGFYYYYKNKNTSDYYVGSRKINSFHLGLSVVATDVGGGFSIGLGGLGFVMGISGSWLLFTGLVGAWLSAVLLIPKVYRFGLKFDLISFPQFLGKTYNSNVAFIASIITAIGYLGFTSSQLLAGSKVASATFNWLTLNKAIIIMGVIAVVYTALGGLKAVIYTDTIQWAVLITGLSLIALPICYNTVGGYSEIVKHIPAKFFSFTNITWQKALNWLLTILPIWFVGMTLYQRIYAAKNLKSAQRAWYIAGIFEYPLMAFIGVILGMLARVAFEKGMFSSIGIIQLSDIDPEMGLPLLLKTYLPIGLMGIMLSVYFSAIMSTADSCLMAASGTIITDILKVHKKLSLFISQILTLIIGASAMFIAIKLPNVLELMLHSYSVMVSGLLIPVLFALFVKKKYPLAAFLSIIVGGGSTLILIILKIKLPYDLSANIFGIAASLLTMVISIFFLSKK